MAAISLVGARAPRGHPPTARVARGVTRGSPPAQVVDCKIGNNGDLATCVVGDRTGEQAARVATHHGGVDRRGSAYERVDRHSSQKRRSSTLTQSRLQPRVAPLTLSRTRISALVRCISPGRTCQRPPTTALKNEEEPPFLGR